MIKQGYKPVWSDKRDLDFHKTFGAIAGKPTEYIEFSVDAEFPVMNQNTMGLPYGCTGMSQGYLCSCQDKILADPAEIYDNTPPGGRDAGREIRLSLARICKVGYRKYLTTETPANPRKKYYSCRAQKGGVIDWFDAIYLAMLVTRDENRAVSIGVPWFPEFQSVDSHGILPMPDDLFTVRATWHNAAVGKIKIINGQPYLAIQSWQGPEYGDKGWCYMGRELANKIFDINGTEAFTVTNKATPYGTQTVDLSLVEYIVSFVKNLLIKFNPPTPMPPAPTPEAPKPTPPVADTVPVKLLWDTKENIRHSIRVICDEEGLDLEQKNTLCATIQAESRFKLDAKNDNLNKDGTLSSTDWGLCQWNDWFHGKEITPDEAVHNPEKAVRLMCSYWLRNQRNQWIAYKNGSYKRYL